MTAHTTRWLLTLLRRLAPPARPNRWPAATMQVQPCCAGGVRTVAVSCPAGIFTLRCQYHFPKDFDEAETLIERLAEKIAGGE